MKSKGAAAFQKLGDTEPEAKSLSNQRASCERWGETVGFGDPEEFLPPHGHSAKQKEAGDKMTLEKVKEDMASSWARAAAWERREGGDFMKRNMAA